MKFSPKVATGGGGHPPSSFCIRYNFWVSQSVEEICGIGFQTSFSLPHKKAGLEGKKMFEIFVWKWGGGGVISQKNILNRGVFSERANLIQTGISCVFVPW